MSIRVVFLGTNMQELERLAGKIKDSEIEIVKKSTDLSNAVSETSESVADLTVISCTEETKALKACEQMYLLNPQMVTVLVSEKESFTLAKRAFAAGAKTVIAPIPEDEEFCEELKKVYYVEQSHISSLMNNSESHRKGTVITVFGAKGGIGKTTTAVNLAVQLAKRKSKVALLDFDLQFGDVDVALGLEPRDTITELLQEQSLPTIDSIRRYFLMHPSGVQVLCAPASPEYADSITGSQLEQVLNIIRGYYDYIIVDTAANFSECNLTLLENSNKILFLTGLDISLLKNSKKGLLLLDSLNQKSKVRVVLNRDIRGDISTKDVENVLGYKLYGIIPNDYQVAVSAINQGVPVVNSFTKTPVARAFMALAARIDKKMLNEAQQISSRKKGK